MQNLQIKCAAKNKSYDLEDVQTIRTVLHVNE